MARLYISTRETISIVLVSILVMLGVTLFIFRIAYSPMSDQIAMAKMKSELRHDGKPEGAEQKEPLTEEPTTQDKKEQVAVASKTGEILPDDTVMSSKKGRPGEGNVGGADLSAGKKGASQTEDMSQEARKPHEKRIRLKLKLHAKRMKIKVKYHDIEAEGRDFIYIVDKSGSMDGERIREAKNELKRSVKELDPRARFHVMFYEGGTFYEMPTRALVPASQNNKQSCYRFIDGINSGGGTDPSSALRRAFSYNPDNIFLLSDGVFNSTIRELIRDDLNRARSVKVHTIAFYDQGGKDILQAIADDNNGIFRFVSRDNTELTRRLREAVRKVKSADYDAAITELRAVLALDSKRVEAHLNLGIALCEIGESLQGINSLEKAASLGSNEARFRLGLVHERSDITASMKNFISYLVREPNGDRADQASEKMLELIKSSIQARKSSEAVKLLTEAISEGLPSAHYYLGVIYDGLNEPETAMRHFVKYYEKAASLGINEAYYHLGVIREKSDIKARMNDFLTYLAKEPSGEYAERVFDKMMILLKALNQSGKLSNNVNALSGVASEGLQKVLSRVQQEASAKLQNKDYNEAVADFKAIVAVDANRAEAHAGLGKALRETGKLQEGISSCKKAIALGSSEAYYELGLIYEDLNDVESAADNFLSYLGRAQAGRHRSEVEERVVKQAKALHRAGRSREGIEILRTAASRGLPDAYYHLGLIYDDLKDAHTAANCFVTYMSKAPKGKCAEQTSERLKRQNYLPVHSGTWLKADRIADQKYGYYKGEWWSPDELQAEGLHLFEGKWYSAGYVKQARGFLKLNGSWISDEKMLQRFPKDIHLKNGRTFSEIYGVKREGNMVSWFIKGESGARISMRADRIAKMDDPTIEYKQKLEALRSNDVDELRELGRWWLSKGRGWPNYRFKALRVFAKALKLAPDRKDIEKYLRQVESALYPEPYYASLYQGN